MVNIYEILKNFPPAGRIQCKGMLFTKYDCPQPEGKERFFVEQNFILYVISGRRILHKERRTWELNEGSCFFIKKGTHIAERMGSDGWCVMAFFMPDDFLKQLIIENNRTLPLNNLVAHGNEHVLPLQADELSKSFFLSMVPYFVQTPPPPEHLVELKFKELILSLLSNKSNVHFLSYLNALAHQAHPSLEEIMEKNFTFNLTLVEYAKLAWKSVPTFNREFKKIFHDSPAKWIQKKRIELAKELLENTSLTVTEISYECGFENHTHFSRVFKEKTSLSPLQFRHKSAVTQ